MQALQEVMSHFAQAKGSLVSALADDDWAPLMALRTSAGVATALPTSRITSPVLKPCWEASPL